MENFLLLFDEIDDAIAVLRSLWPSLLGFLLACSVFALNVVMILRWPGMTLAALGILGASMTLPVLRSISLKPFRTDP